MAKTPRRLGRGLDSLVSTIPAVDPPDAPAAEAKPKASGGRTDLAASKEGTARTLPIDDLAPNRRQPRGSIDAENVISLARSIKRSGVLQPVVVRPDGDRFEIIAGERRWRAAKSIGMKAVPAIIRQATDEQMLELALIENIQREDLNAIDRAKAYRHFCDEFSLKAEEVAGRLGEDRTTVVNYLRLLDLAEPIQNLVADGKLSMGHARCLLGVTSEQRRLKLAESVVDNALSVRALEEIVRREKTRREDDTPGGRLPEAGPSAHIVDMQRRFEEALKTKVVIHEGRRRGKGRIIIEYYSLDDFDRVAEMLSVDLE